MVAENCVPFFSLAVKVDPLEKSLYIDLIMIMTWVRLAALMNLMILTFIVIFYPVYFTPM